MKVQLRSAVRTVAGGHSVSFVQTTIFGPVVVLYNHEFFHWLRNPLILFHHVTERTVGTETKKLIRYRNRHLKYSNQDSLPLYINSNPRSDELPPTIDQFQASF
jgi:hypothetical protein